MLVMSRLKNADPNEIALFDITDGSYRVNISLVIAQTYSAEVSIAAHVDAVPAIQAMRRSMLFKHLLNVGLSRFQWPYTRSSQNFANGMLFLGHAQVWPVFQCR